MAKVEHCGVCGKLLASAVHIYDGTATNTLASTSQYVQGAVTSTTYMPPLPEVCYGHGDGPNRAQRRRKAAKVSRFAGF